MLPAYNGAMVAWLAILLCALFAPWIGWRGLQKRFPSLEPSEAFGLLGVILLLGTGWLTFLLGQFIPSGTAALFSFGIALVFAASLSPKKPELPAISAEVKPFLLGICVLFLVPIFNSLAPSNMLDWDTLAYHFAVPKLWIESGKMDYIPFIHQSNFPFIIDNLFLVGLQLGSEQGAKAFTLLFLIFGTFWLRGFLVRKFTEEVANFGVLIWLGAPITLWLTGSGYLDTTHGLLCAMGLIYLAESLSLEDFRHHIVLSGIGLGGALGSKYTGLQVCLIAFLFLAFGLTTKKLNWKSAGIAFSVAIVIGSPWYIRNVANTGNPVFPFFYSALGGKNWDSWRSEIYTNEQKSFGVPPTITNAGHATFGLAYQSGKFINPGQQEGFGAQAGSIGLVSLLGFLGYGLLGKKSGFLNSLAIMTLIQLGFWFLLSQQVRYLTAILPILAILGCALLAQLNRQQIFAKSLIGLQAFYSLFTLYQFQTSAQIPVALGAVDRETYQKQVVAFAGFAEEINQAVPENGKIALYDEVFGYFLDRPYFWANPGHSTLLNHDPSQTGKAFADNLKAQGFTHIYVSMRWWADPDMRVAFLNPQAQLPEPMRASLLQNKESVWIALVHQGVIEGAIRPEKFFGSRQREDGSSTLPSGVLFTLN